MMKRNEGFTLVELLVAMVVGSIVTLAATSVLLLGLRYNAISIGAAQRQNTTRIIMSLLEGVASEGQIKGVESKLDSWRVLGENDTVFASYHSKTRTIYANSFVIEKGQNGEEDKITGTPLLEGVLASHASLSNNGLLTVSVETEDGSYVSSIYCRTYFDNTTGDAPDIGQEDPLDSKNELLDQIEKNPSPEEQRKNFIDTLLSQYPTNGMPNPGVILDGGVSTSWYYAQWYVGSQGVSGWDSSTPWCACYISWALVESGIPSGVDGRDKWYANVDEFMEYFTNGSFNETASWSNASPATGDLVFFDWEGGNDPEHVGVVLMENGDFIYTIEGNSAGLVAMRMYSTSDPAIIGYGKLNFPAEEQTVDVETLKGDILAAINAERSIEEQLAQDEKLNELADQRAFLWVNDPQNTELDNVWKQGNDDRILDPKGETRIPNADVFYVVPDGKTWLDYASDTGPVTNEIYDICGIGICKTDDGSYCVIILFAG